MKTKTLTLAASLALICAFTGCETVPELVDQGGDTGHTTSGLDYRDFQMAAEVAIKDMIDSGNLDHPGGGRYVLMIGRVIPDSTVSADPDQLVKKIRVALMKCGKVVVSTAVGLGGPEDQSTGLVQDEFGGGGIAKPELSLSGRIIGKNLYYDSSKAQQEYYLQLTLTNLAGGYSVWEGETPIVKRVSSKTVTW